MAGADDTACKARLSRRARARDYNHRRPRQLLRGWHNDGILVT
jgi:hypothetical protein